jgi:hypothetical protein
MKVVLFIFLSFLVLGEKRKFTVEINVQLEKVGNFAVNKDGSVCILFVPIEKNYIVLCSNRKTT